MAGAHGVFSVQPSSGQGERGISDEQEERYGRQIADLAHESGVAHLVYSSICSVGDRPTGMGYMDSKARIEDHIHTLPITATIVRPVTFMDMLMMPGFGLDEGRFLFFLRPDQTMQLLAVADIGRYVAAIFADPARFGGEALEIASDEVTGREIEAALSQAAGRPIGYSRFPDEVLSSNPFLARLTALMDDGRLAGHARPPGITPDQSGDAALCVLAGCRRSRGFRNRARNGWRLGIRAGRIKPALSAALRSSNIAADHRGRTARRDTLQHGRLARF